MFRGAIACDVQILAVSPSDLEAPSGRKLENAMRSAFAVVFRPNIVGLLRRENAYGWCQLVAVGLVLPFILPIELARADCQPAVPAKNCKLHRNPEQRLHSKRPCKSYDRRASQFQCRVPGVAHLKSRDDEYE